MGREYQKTSCTFSFNRTRDFKIRFLIWFANKQNSHSKHSACSFVGWPRFSLYAKPINDNSLFYRSSFNDTKCKTCLLDNAKPLALATV